MLKIQEVRGKIENSTTFTINSKITLTVLLNKCGKNHIIFALYVTVSFIADL